MSAQDGTASRVTLSLAANAIYVCVSLLLEPDAAASIAALSLLPVILTAAQFGLRAALANAVALFLVHSLTLLVFTQSDSLPFDLAGYAAILTTGGLVAFLIHRRAPSKQGKLADKSVLELEVERRQRVEESLKLSEERYEMLWDASMDAICLLNARGKIREVNHGAESLFGYTKNELLDLDISALYPSSDHWERVRSLLGEQGQQDELVGLEVWISRKDGSQVECLQTVNVWRAGKGEAKGYRSVFRDISAQKRAEELIERSEDQLQLAMQAARMATWDMEVASKTIIPSNNLLLLLHLSSHIAVDHYQLLLQRLHEGDRLSFDRAVTQTLNGKGPFALEVRVITSTGDLRWFASQGQLVEANDGWHLVGTFVDITERKLAEDRIEHLGFYDPLTELPNRRLLNDRINTALAQARRSQKMVAVLNLDLDRFKLINDTLGHAAGDRLLQDVAERLSNSTRPHDTVARQGGDEFMVLLPAVSKREEVEVVARRILDVFREPFLLMGRRLHVTTSIGIALFPEDGEGPEPLLRNADAAMYRVKESGRNSYEFHTPAMYAEAFGRLELETGIRSALENNEFVVHYQPQVSVATGKVIGAEALVRWVTPNGLLLLPGEFIPLAEESGLIVGLGEWILRAVCRDIRHWLDQNLPGLPIAVNFSARQFEHPNLTGLISSILRETEIEPQWLEVEITETTAMRDVKHTQETLRRLRDLGVRAFLDDFGTGHASLNYLKDFPLHSLKIDRSFVSDLEVDEQNRAITTAIIGLGQALRLHVVAEGVETAEQLEFLRSRACDAYQGYLFSKAIPADEFASMVQNQAQEPIALAG